MYKNIKKLNPTTLEDIANSYEYIEAFLENNQYLCGDNITVSDISCATSIRMLQLFVPIPKKLVKTTAWLQRVTNYPPFAEVDKPGQMALELTLKSLI